MKKIQFTALEVEQLKAIKKYFITDSKATTSSQTENSQKLAKIAAKYNVDTQVIWDSIPN